jgi:hypothetical protein
VSIESSATIQEWLLAAEYSMSGGNYEVIRCERGIRIFETYTRNTFGSSCRRWAGACEDLDHALARRSAI